MRLFTPDFYYTNVEAIDLGALSSSGIRVLLIDLDNTLLARDTSEVTPQLVEWARTLSEYGMRGCLVSNNWRSHVLDIARELGFEIIPKALKPLPFAFRRALRLLDAAPEEAAVVGDQLFTDVLGGNLIGLTTVLVVPLSQHDLPHTLLLRLIEARIMADREPLA